MTTERAESKHLCEFLKSKVKGNKYHLSEYFEVVERQHVISDFTIAPDKNREWKAYPGTLQQDVIIKLKNEYVNGNLINGLSSRKNMIIPIVIIELKMSSTFNTHHLITYSAIAGRIKQIFPLCQYFFVVKQQVKQNRRLKKITELRHASGFDYMLEDWTADKDVLWEHIRLHLMHVIKYHIGNKVVS